MKSHKDFDFKWMAKNRGRKNETTDGNTNYVVSSQVRTSYSILRTRSSAMKVNTYR